MVDIRESQIRDATQRKKNLYKFNVVSPIQYLNITAVGEFVLYARNVREY